ncbi:hypothetical protein [Moorena sp. SIOASIH]|nr:hypothetical protein [Moorena sp. SIOASIH]
MVSREQGTGNREQKYVLTFTKYSSALISKLLPAPYSLLPTP